MVDMEMARSESRRRLLGWGAALEEILPGIDLGRDIRFERGQRGIDLARVAGDDNLAQDLEVALTTLLGSDIFDTRAGFDGLNALAEETDPLLARERVRVSVVQVLQRDPRVRRILDVQLVDGRLAGLPPGARELDVHVAFETVAGDDATLALGRLTALTSAGVARPQRIEKEQP
jgi:hypothetical protein